MWSLKASKALDRHQIILGFVNMRFTEVKMDEVGERDMKEVMNYSR